MVQFYLEGFYPGDPQVLPADPEREAASRAPLPELVDVLIVGSGPAGLVLAAQLAAFPGVTTRVVERKSGPLEMGQADGIACRTVEMFDAFGASDRLLKEGYWVNETVFWKPDSADRSRIVRSGRVQDTQDGLSEFPHLIVNQARIHQYLLDSMLDSPSRLRPDYGISVVGVEVDGVGEHPVSVTLRDIAPDGTEGAERVIRAKYVVGCDGARSTVRASIGLTLAGDAANQAWGVMDVLPSTDFPDIRFKTAIQSGSAGNMLIIPREGGHMVRFYIELEELAPRQRVADLGITDRSVIDAARRIIQPYRLDVEEVVWWSAYEIGQRVADRFDDSASSSAESLGPRVFIAGDACHTHSPKAGQGMNVSMQDAFNLGWKLAAVLEGRATGDLLRTYSEERQAIAQGLIDFDRDFARMFSAPAKDEMTGNDGGVAPEEFQRRFAAAGKYTAGVATRYAPSSITAAADSQHLATGFPIGERFHSAPVVRLADAKPMQLGHVHRADGRWRLYLFADAADPRDQGSRMAGLCSYLADDPASPVRRFTPEGADPDAVFDVLAVFQQGHRDLTPEWLPEILLPKKGRYGLTDYEKAFCSDLRGGELGGTDIFDERGIDRAAGAIVVVRPDQYVADVVALDDTARLERFFGAFLR